MKKIVLKLVLTITSFISCSAYSTFINQMNVSIDNQSDYQLENISQINDEKGYLERLYISNLMAQSQSDLAQYKANFLGQLSQDINISLYDAAGGYAGTCNVHVGLGSYVAKPDFTGSVCNLTNGDYLQLNPIYTVEDNTYKVEYKLNKAKSFSRVIVFGDSMSDNGNLYKRSVELSLIFPISPILPVSPPYFDGRFTNGQVWVELLSKKLNIPEGSLINYAYAGASVKKDYMPIPSLDKQVNKYLNWNHSGDPYALYVVWIGSNDILRGHQRDENDLLNSISSGIEYNIRRLIQHGAKHIFSPQLPDLSLVPDSYEKDQANGDVNYSNKLKRLTQKYNAKHKELLGQLRQEFPEVKIMSFDVYQFLNDARDKASDYGFSYTHERCNPNSYWADELATCIVPKEYVFWDGVHPTARAHQILSGLMYNIIAKHGYEPNMIMLKATDSQKDDFIIRNEKAVRELQKEIDLKERYAYGLDMKHLRAVIENNIQLF